MLHTLLMAAFLLAAQEPQQTGTIVGSLVPAQPVQVILLSPEYTDLWSTEVQKRLDLYWQQYQVAVRTRKEYFSELSKQAHRDATYYVLNRMRRDASAKSADYLIQTSTDGKFEFKNVPFGEYRILAIGKIGNQDVIWQEFVNVQSQIPHFLELNKRIP
jgi:hypothetical protein